MVDVILNCPRHILERQDTVDVTLRRDGPTTRLPRELVEPLLVETPLPARSDSR